jgi:very-short-patch-repair endonuclease
MRDEGLSPQSKGESLKNAWKRSEKARLMGEVIRLHDSGLLCKEIGRILGLGGATVKSYLKKFGITPPNSTEANRIIWGRKTEEERNAFSSQINKPGMFEKIAVGKGLTKSMVGMGEKELRERLLSRGFCFSSQFPIATYNIDLFWAPVAVEVHASSAHPLQYPNAKKRLEYLLNGGFWVIFVVVRTWRKEFILEEGAVDQIVFFIEESRRNPSGRGKYRVIGGNGKEFLFRGRKYIDYFPFVLPPESS